MKISGHFLKIHFHNLVTNIYYLFKGKPIFVNIFSKCLVSSCFHKLIDLKITRYIVSQTFVRAICTGRSRKCMRNVRCLTCFMLCSFGIEEQMEDTVSGMCSCAQLCH